MSVCSSFQPPHPPHPCSQGRRGQLEPIPAVNGSKSGYTVCSSVQGHIEGQTWTRLHSHTTRLGRIQSISLALDCERRLKCQRRHKENMWNGDPLTVRLNEPTCYPYSSFKNAISTICKNKQNVKLITLGREKKTAGEWVTFKNVVWTRGKRLKCPIAKGGGEVNSIKYKITPNRHWGCENQKRFTNHFEVKNNEQLGS